MASSLRSEAADYSLLPKDRTFGNLIPAFALPYLAYVAIPGLLSGLLGPDLAQLLRFAVVAGLLFRFRRSYAFGPRLTGAQAVFALAAAALATLLWFAVLRSTLAIPHPFFADRLAKGSAAEFSLLYAALRTANSVLLVPIFEELLFRAWAQETLGPAAPGDSETLALDRKPRPLTAPPLSVRAVAMACAVFALGHDPAAVPAAIAYYLLTTAAYGYTRSFRVCVLIHALVNGALAIAVVARPDLKFLWF